MARIESPMQSLNTSVAPMEGFTTFPMRLWLGAASRPKAMTTPFLRVTRTHPNGSVPTLFAPELFELRGVMPYVITPQLITGDPELYLKSADLFPPEVAPVLELNCGCPSPSCVGSQAGSGILRDPDHFRKTLDLITQRLGPGRLAVKMRLGVEDVAEFERLITMIADLPLARLTVHGRTRADRYRGYARWDLIEYAAASTSIPIWASGDVCGMETAKQLEVVAPSIAGAVIGGGLLSNPWIFEEISSQVHQTLTIRTLANSLLCYVMLNELSIKDPEKLIAKVQRKHLITYCGTDEIAWERLAAELTNLVFRVPMVINHRGDTGNITISNTSFGRLRVLWSYLRSSLPEPFHAPKILRSKNITEFFAQFFLAYKQLDCDDVILRHQPEWDEVFAGVRGPAPT